MSLLSSDAAPIPKLKPPLLEILLAAGAHLSGFFAPFLAPLIIWLIARKWLPFVGQHARSALVTHLLTLLAIGVFGTLAILVFVLFLGGTLSVPPTGGGFELLYFIVFVVFALAAFVAWVFGEVSCVFGAIRAIQGKPAHALRSRRQHVKPSKG